MWWEYGRKQLLETVKGFEELALQSETNLNRAVSWQIVVNAPEAA